MQNVKRKFYIPLKNLRFKEEVKFLHLGTIYSSRNFDNLIIAMNQLIQENNNNISFSISNIGIISKENYPKNVKSINFNELDSVSRKKGLLISQNFDSLLLIQHTDDRIKLTIPYKTWDYLNLNKPILGLLNNDELGSLLKKHGHYTANNRDIDSIKSMLRKFIDDYYNKKISIKKNQYDLVNQVKQLIAL